MGFYSSVIIMMHGPTHIKFVKSSVATDETGFKFFNFKGPITKLLS